MTVFQYARSGDIITRKRDKHNPKLPKGGHGTTRKGRKTQAGPRGEVRDEVWE